MKRSAFVIFALAALALAAFATELDSPTPQPGVTPNDGPSSTPSPNTIPDQQPTGSPAPGVATPVDSPAPAPVTPPAPVAQLTPSNGLITFSVFTSDDCSANSLFFTSSVRNNDAQCQTILVSGVPAYVKMGCYSNLTVTGTNYMTSQNCVNVAGTFPLAPSGACVPVTVPGAPNAKSFRGYCPDDPNYPRTPSPVPQVPQVPTPSGAPATIALSIALVLLALFGTLVM